MIFPLPSLPGKVKAFPARIVFFYGLFSALWIFVSSALLTISVDDPVLQGRIEFGKGLLYVLVSSSLLYLVLKQWCDPLPPMAPTQAGSASRTPRPAKLYRRVLALAALLALVPLAGLVVVKVHRPQIEREALANLEAIAELKASQIENWFGERYNDGMIIMSAPGFIRQVSELQRDGSAKNREAVLAGLIAVVDAVQYESALLLDPSGRTLITLGEHSHVQPQTAALLSHAQELGRPVSTEIFIAPGGDRHLDFIAPLFLFADGRRQSVGFLVLHVSPETFLFPYLLHWPTASVSGESLLVRRDGESVLFVNELRHGKTGQLFSIPLDRSDCAAVAVREARIGNCQGPDYRDIPVFSAHRSVTGTDWMIVAKLDGDEVLASLRDLSFWVSLITLLAISAVGAVMLMLWRQSQRTFALEMQAQSDVLLRQFYTLPFIGIATS